MNMSDMSETLVDIVIASWTKDPRSKVHLDFCLETIECHTPIPHRVLLERSDGSASENRNRALARSTAPYVCFLDDDAWVTPDWIEGMLSVMDQDPAIGMVGPKIKLETGRIFCFGIEVNELNEFAPFGYNQHDGEAFSKGYEPFAIPTTCMLVRREAITAAGSFDEGYSLCQWEDLDYYLKLRSTGYKGWVHPDVVVYHANLFRSTTAEENKQYLLSKWSDEIRKYVRK